MQCTAVPSSQILLASYCREVVRKPPSFFSPNSVKLLRVERRTCNMSFRMQSSMSLDNERGFVREETTSSSTLGEEDAVIIVDHGSRRQESNLMLNEFVAMFRGRTGYRIVEPAHMELAEPSIKDAFRLCVQQGAKRIIDIPSLAAEAASEHSGISYILTAPLGLHELMVDVMNDRIKQCLSHVAGNADECNVCAGTGRCREY